LTIYGRAVTPGPELGDEVRHLDGVLGAAARAGHHEGVFGPDDLLLEQLLAGSTRVAHELTSRVLDPLVAQDPDGIFVATLRTYLGCGSVPETAEHEVVHRTWRRIVLMIPDAIEPVDEIPTTSVGKLDKNVFRGQLDVVLDRSASATEGRR